MGSCSNSESSCRKPRSRSTWLGSENRHRRRGVLSLRTTCSSWCRRTSSSCRSSLFESYTSLSSWRTRGDACSISTSQPILTSEWTAQQMVEAFPWGSAPRYLLHDRDSIYEGSFRQRVRGMAIQEVLTAPRSPWQIHTPSASSAPYAANASITLWCSTNVLSV